MKNHIFVYVLNRSDDPFLGIKNLISLGDTKNRIVDVKLDLLEYESIRNVEYTWRRYVRFFYYRRIFHRFAEMISSAIRDEADNIIYMADEGLWGVFLNNEFWRSSVPYITVNVQHGFFDLESDKKNNSYMLRRFINAIMKPILKGPVFGYGFGGGGFDVYLCYGEEEARWLRGLGHKSVYSCPELIKFGFVKRYRALKESRDVSKAVFILPASVPGSSFTCRLPEFLLAITPLIKYLAKERRCSITLRTHPGGDTKKESEIILASPLGMYVKIDDEVDIAKTMAAHPLVMSAHSTALFEAQMVGRCAVAVSTPCYDRPIHYLHRTIDLTSPDWKERLNFYLEEYSNGVGAFHKKGVECRCPSELLDQIIIG